MTILERLTKVCRNTFNDDSIELTPATTADDIEGWDSLSHVNLIIAVEMEFNIEFKQSEVLSFANIGELASRIEKKISQKIK